MKRLPKRVLAVFRGLLGVGLLAYLVAGHTVELAALGGLTDHWRRSLIALGLSSVVILLVSWRLCLLLRAHDYELPFGSAVRLSLIGAFFSAFLPGSSGGDVARMYLAARPHPGHGTEIATVVAFDRIVGALSLLTLPLLVALAMGVAGAELPGLYVGLLWVASGGLATFALVVYASRRETLRRGILGALGHGRIRRHGRRVFETIDAFGGRMPVVVGAFLLSLLIQVLVVFVMLLLARATGAVGATWPILLAIPFGMLANAVPITPGGIGVGEAAFAALFAAGGASGGAEALIAWRLVTTVIDLVGGFLFVLGRTRVRMTGRARGAGLDDVRDHV